MNKTTVVIADDHALIQDTWSSLLSSNIQYDIVGRTNDGERAVDLVRHKRPDILLVDINMVPVDGFEVLKQVRNFSPNTKVIGVSMHAQPIYAKKMMREGAKGYITKGSGSEEFMHAVNEVAQGRQYICRQIKDILAEQVLNIEKPVGIQHLSKRELEIIRYIRDGTTSKEIAEILSISPKTIEVHRHNILKKLGVKNSTELVHLINEHGL